MLSCYVYSNASDADLELTGAHAWELYAACLADINAGRLGAEDVSGVGTKDDADYTPLYLMFIVTTNTPGETVNLYVDSIPLGTDETVRVLGAGGRRDLLEDELTNGTKTPPAGPLARGRFVSRVRRPFSCRFSFSDTPGSG